MNPTLFMVAIIAVLASAVFVLFRLWRKEKNTAKEPGRKEKKTRTSPTSTATQRSLRKSKKNSGEEYRLEDATDEEIAAVVAAVIAGNNGLCDGEKDVTVPPKPERRRLAGKH